MTQSDYNSFGKDYFRSRHGNDVLRQKSFKQEKAYLKNHLGGHVFEKGCLLDVGCSTGEFIKAVEWNVENCYGMEISQYARTQAEQAGIKFDKDLFNSTNYFDLIVYRGTIQYIPNPFEYIQKSYDALKPEGCIAFFATPNSNSIYYRLFKTLPFLEEKLNYLIPSDTSLVMNLQNAGFEIVDVSFPYLSTPYASPIVDHVKFLKKLVFKTHDKFPFWKSSMVVLAKKPSST